MIVTLASGGFAKVFSNVLSVNVSLRNGSAQILPNHQDLIGKVENNLLQINTENDSEKTNVFIQDGIFIVSNEEGKTSVYIFSKRILDFDKTGKNRNQLDELKKELENKKQQILVKKEKQEKNPNLVSSLAAGLTILEDETKFIEEYLKVIES